MQDPDPAFELFQAALAAPADRREDVVRASGADPAVRRRVLAMLAADSGDSPLDGRSVAQGVAAAVLGEPGVPLLVGDYRVIRRLGAGANGVVYEAEQRSPRRRVAIKALLPSRNNAEALRQFRREAEALARLQHPCIAAVYEAGASDESEPDRAFIAMELVVGRPITGHADVGSLGRRERVGLLLEVAGAIAHAHARGVIHRDLKPANILVTDDGRPKVLDFGVARVADPHADATASLDGRIVGTLAYMSPEQAAGEQGLVDARSDVFALGVILHELLTGRPLRPIEGLGLQAALDVVRSTVTISVDSLSRELGRDLAVVIARATHADPERRYQSVAQLSDDLQRWLDGRPVHARAESGYYLFTRFLARHKAAALGVASVALIVAVSAVVAGAQAVRLDRLHHRATALNESLSVALVEAEVDRARMELRAGGQSRAERRLWTLAAEHPDAEPVVWALWEMEAASPCERTVAFGFPPVSGLAVSQDGSAAAFVGASGRVAVTRAGDWSVRATETGGNWKLAAWPEGAGPWTFDGTGGAAGWADPPGEAPMWIAPTALGSAPVAACARGGFVVAALSGGRLVGLAGEGDARWNAELDAPVYALEPDGPGAVLASTASGWFCVEASTGAVLAQGDEEIRLLAAGRAGDGSLYLGGADRVLRRSPDDTPLARTATIFRSIAPDAQGVLVSEALGVRRFDASTGELTPAGSPIDAVLDARRVGDRFVLLDEGGYLRILNTDAQNPLVNTEHTSWVFTVRPSPDGRTVATGGADGVVRVWDARLAGPLATLALPPGKRTRMIRYTPDGQRLAVAVSDGSVLLASASDGRVLATLPTGDAEVYSLAISPAGDRLAAGSIDRSVRVFDLASGSAEPVAVVTDLPNAARGMVYSPDGSVLYASAGESAILGLDANTLAVAETHALPDDAWSVDLSPDGRLLACGLFDGSVSFIDLESGVTTTGDGGHHLVVAGLAWSRSGRLLATAAEDGAIVLWSASSLKPVARLAQSFGPAPGLAWSPGDRFLYAATSAGRVVRWDMDRPWADALANAPAMLERVGRPEAADRLGVSITRARWPAGE